MSQPKPEAGNFAARFTLTKGIIDELGDILLADIVAVRQMLIDGNVGEALEYLTIMQEAVEKEMGDEDE